VDKQQTASLRESLIGLNQYRGYVETRSLSEIKCVSVFIVMLIDEIFHGPIAESVHGFKQSKKVFLAAIGRRKFSVVEI
jgi:hypothetical protein